MYIRFWALKLRCNQCEFCGQGGLQKCKRNLFLNLDWGGHHFLVEFKIESLMLLEGCKSSAWPFICEQTPSPKARWGCFQHFVERRVTCDMTNEREGFMATTNQLDPWMGGQGYTSTSLGRGIYCIQAYLSSIRHKNP